MKIKRFNESNEFSSPKRILCVYDAGGTVRKTIVFDSVEELNNHILNFVNEFIIGVEFDEDFWEDFDIEVVKDQDGNWVITDPDEAYDWLNTYNDSSEPTLGICNYEEIKNVKIEDRITLAMSANKYNL